MHKIIDTILKCKEADIIALKDKLSKKNTFKSALTSNGMSIISEIKRSSPSKGELKQVRCPISLVESYISGGASAISILTEKDHFSGSIEDLSVVKKYLNEKGDMTPILRKDFILDEIQLIEAIYAGADAVLLIVSILGNKKVATLLEKAKAFGIEVLVEVHNEDELNIALDAGADIIGINNRDLKTFKVDLDISFNLVNKIPSHIVKVSESGVSNPSDIKRLKEIGFDAVLVGEALMRSETPALLIKQMRGVVA